MIKKPNKKAIIVIGVLLLLLCIGAVSMAFTTSDIDAPEKTVVEINDNMELGSDNLEDMSESKMEAHDIVERSKKKEDRVREKDQSIWENLDLGQDQQPNQGNDSPVVVGSNNNQAYERAQRQLRNIEARKNQVSKTKVNQQKEEALEKANDEQDEILEGAQQDMDAFFSANPNRGSSKGKEKEGINKGPTDPLIRATIKHNQSVKNSGRVTMTLSKEYIINGTLYPENTIIYGVSKFSTNRVDVTVTKINHNSVDLRVFDAQDGLKGIYIEGEDLAGEMIKETTEDGLEQIDVNGLPVGNTIKNIFRKRNKVVKVQLLNNYEIVLKPGD